MIFFGLKEFGSVLTGREYGKTVYETLAAKLTHPAGLDFEGVESMGSSFGDEIVIPIARAQGNKIVVKNANPVITSCLTDIAEESQIDIEIKS
ncbi:MAG: STAS-like domain-containing protein [Calothrix sp. SM1_5_4]|nr:STAS-like domain-containing protein [Calothrix sp. SM1_5_4]